MKDKAELDVLEIEHGDDTIPKEDGAESPPVQAEREPLRQGGRLWKKAALIVLLVLALAAALSLWLYSGKEKTEKARGKPPAGSAPVAGPFVSLEKFAVNLKDAQGNYRVLACDVTLEMSRDGLASDRTTELRKIVYRTIREQGARILSEPRSLKPLAKEIEKRVNDALGEGSVRQAYITKFTLL